MRTAKLRIYLDTSAYLQILLGQSQAGYLVASIRNKVLCSSTLLLIEVERNLIRLTREKEIAQSEYSSLSQKLQDDIKLFILRDFSSDLCFTGTFPATRIPRSLDLIHIRTAKWFQSHGGLAKFVTADNHQRAAAQEVGLPT